MSDACPFRVGDEVVYRPTPRGFGLSAMIGQLRPGQKYKVEAIQNDSYVLVENYAYLGGGIYWTEFAPIKADEVK